MRGWKKRDHGLLRLVWLFRGDIRQQGHRLALAGLVLLTQVGVELLLPWPLKVIIDNVIRSKPLKGVWATILEPVANTPRTLLWVMLVSMVVLAAINAVLEYHTQAMLLRVGQSLILSMRKRVYAHLQRLSFAFHTAQPVGDLCARVTTDINALQDLFVSGVKNFATNGMLLLGIVVVMLAIDWRFTFAALAVLPVLGWLVVRFKPRVKRASRAAKRKEREMASLVHETLVSFRVVQAFSAEDFEDRRFGGKSSTVMAARLEAGELQARFAPAVELTLAAGTALVAGLGAFGALTGPISIGTLLVFLTYLKSMYSPIKQLAKAQNQLVGATVSAELILELLQTNSRPIQRSNAILAPRLKGQIEFCNVNFAYAQRQAVLKNVSLCIKPGQHCVIVGRTGVGKSTLASLLPRFIDPDTGKVCIDGYDIRDFILESLRENISIVLQEALLFRMTVKENIAYAMSGVSDQQIQAAAKAANAHEFIEQLPQGYHTLLEERGGNLSGGQRQRITLARAFLRDAPILILDEPTTGLDLASEALVLQALQRLTRGKTTLTIAHRLSTIEHADLVVMLDAGRIADCGTHAELIARSVNYRSLYQRQIEQTAAPITGPWPSDYFRHAK